jgi:uncharacterized protein YjiS (DUF1127 family)
MWSADQVYRDWSVLDTPAAETPRMSTSSDTAYHPSPAGRCEDSGSLVSSHPADKRGRDPKRIIAISICGDASRRPIVKAMSWLVARVIEVFTVYAAAMDSTRSAGAQCAPQLRSLSPIARSCSWVRSERQVRRMVAQLEAFDDRMLRDIGIHCCRIESVARHGNPYRG